MTVYQPVSKGSRDFLCVPNLCMQIEDICYTVWLSCLRIEIGFFQVKLLVTGTHDTKTLSSRISSMADECTQSSEYIFKVSLDL
jgi:hypothetical protein